MTARFETEESRISFVDKFPKHLLVMFIVRKCFAHFLRFKVDRL